MGKALSKSLLSKRYDVVILSRSSSTQVEKGAGVSQWNPAKGQIDMDLRPDAIINLAGTSIATKWTDENKRRIISSRVDSTKTLVQLANQSEACGVFVNASATGIYKGGLDLVDESGEADDTFGAEIVKQWEAACDGLRSDCVLHKARIGIVLNLDGGYIPTVLPLYKRGLGAPISPKPGWISWIHIDDVVGALVFMLNRVESNTWNLVAPNPVMTKTMSESMAATLNKAHWAPSPPAFMLKLMYGPFAGEMLKSYRIHAGELLKAGYQFSYPDLEPALEDLLK